MVAFGVPDSLGRLHCVKQFGLAVPVWAVGYPTAIWLGLESHTQTCPPHMTRWKPWWIPLDKQYKTGPGFQSMFARRNETFQKDVVYTSIYHCPSLNCKWSSHASAIEQIFRVIEVSGCSATSQWKRKTHGSIHITYTEVHLVPETILTTALIDVITLIVF